MQHKLCHKHIQYTTSKKRDVVEVAHYAMRQEEDKFKMTQTKSSNNNNTEATDTEYNKVPSTRSCTMTNPKPSNTHNGRVRLHVSSCR